MAKQTAGILVGLQHDGRHRADKHGFGDAFGAVTADVMGDFAAAGGMSNVDGVFQLQRFDERGKVVRIGVHFVAVPRLA